MSITKLLVLIVSSILVGCNNNSKNNVESVNKVNDTIQNLDLDKLYENFYSNIKTRILNNDEVINKIQNLDSSVIFIIPVKNCFSCISESIDKIVEYTKRNNNYTVVFVYDSKSVLDKQYKDIKIDKNKQVFIKYSELKNHGILAVLRLNYYKNKESNIVILK